MRRVAVALALALFVGSAAAQPSAPVVSAPATVPLTIAEFRGDRPNDEPWLMIITDGRGWARVGIAAGHGGIAFQTIDGLGYMIIDDERDLSRLGRQEEMLELMVSDQGDWRRLALGLGRQQIEIAQRGSETIAGVTGQVYAMTLIEEGRRSAPYEVVISTDPRLAATGRELLRVYDLVRAPLIRLHGREPQPYTAFRALLARGAPIRIGPHYRLRELGGHDVPAERLVVRGTVLDRAAFVAVLRQQLMREPGSDIARDVPPQGFNESDDMANAVADAVNMAAADAIEFENEAYADNATAPE